MEALGRKGCNVVKDVFLVSDLLLQVNCPFVNTACLERFMLFLKFSSEELADRSQGIFWTHKVSKKIGLQATVNDVVTGQASKLDFSL